MIIEQGIVKFIDSSRVTVECRSRLDCIRCAQGKGCGGGILSRWLGNRQFQIKAYYDSGQVRPQIGQVVSVGFPASRLVHLAAIMYGLPLLLVILFLGVQVSLFPDSSEFVSILLATLALLAGFKTASMFVKNANTKGKLLPSVLTGSSDNLAGELACSAKMANSS